LHLRQSRVHTMNSPDADDFKSLRFFSAVPRELRRLSPEGGSPSVLLRKNHKKPSSNAMRRAAKSHIPKSFVVVTNDAVVVPHLEDCLDEDDESSDSSESDEEEMKGSSGKSFKMRDKGSRGSMAAQESRVKWAHLRDGHSSARQTNRAVVKQGSGATSGIDEFASEMLPQSSFKSRKPKVGADSGEETKKVLCWRSIRV
jgi:hypothetical protein